MGDRHPSNLLLENRGVCCSVIPQYLAHSTWCWYRQDPDLALISLGGLEIPKMSTEKKRLKIKERSKKMTTEIYLFHSELIGRKVMSAVWVNPSQPVRTNITSHLSPVPPKNKSHGGQQVNAASLRRVNWTDNEAMRETQNKTLWWAALQRKREQYEEARGLEQSRVQNYRHSSS